MDIFRRARHRRHHSSIGQTDSPSDRMVPTPSPQAGPSHGQSPAEPSHGQSPAGPSRGPVLVQQSGYGERKRKVLTEQKKAAVSMEASSTQTLRSAENLSLPEVLVCEADCEHGSDANLGASDCYDCQYELQPLQDEDLQGRLLDYTVDMTKKEVTMRGVIETEKGGTCQTKKKISLSLFGLECFGAT
ncbi:hypothetical protein ZIOFF_019745 [Zingiber officinale]|uniref:Uncharacterized protein n=1 Tax=Zingiber officinale TaxID=94328 RepID=A0A8J5LJF8_ZINOF|nr:hypothetical protein ZIOFF_019745 [Zingiber officinale]